MTLEIFKAITPFITLFLSLVMAVLGWLIIRMISSLKSDIDGRFCEVNTKIGKLEDDLEKMRDSRAADKQYMIDSFVQKEAYMLEIGGNRKMNDQIFNRINMLDRTVHQFIGEIKGWRGSLNA